VTNFNLASYRVADVYYADSKLDDGIASSGKYITVNSGLAATNCITGDNYTTDGSAKYNMSDTSTDCEFFYVIR
jgi:hypothetical protein